MIGFRMPTHIHIEPGCLSRLPEVLGKLQASRILLMIDPGLAATPWPDKVRAALAGAGIEGTLFDRVEPNPRTTTTEKAGTLARKEGLEAVVGLGGGSVLDAAKGAAMLANNPGKVSDYIGKNRFSRPPLPFVAIPTTCGTGSEVTWVSVLTDQEARTKISVKGDLMFPKQALVDAELLRTLPASLVAATGLDAFTHAIEATTCNLSNPVSDLLAEQALSLLWTYLPRAVADIQGDDRARLEVMRASTIAGMAFGNADVASVHCLSESLGGMLDLPHGLTNAVLLPPALAYNRPHIDRRLAELHGLLIDGDSPASVEQKAEAFIHALLAFSRDLGIPAFSSLAIDPTHYCDIANRASDNCSNPSYARAMDAEDYLQLLEIAARED